MARLWKVKHYCSMVKADRVKLRRHSLCAF